MPGIVGFVGEAPGGSEERFLFQMAHALEPGDAYRFDGYHAAGIGLGRVHLGILNPQTQPVWNETRSVCVLMEGELYDTQSIKTELLQRGHRFQLHSDAELLLHLYTEFGESFATKTNGAFAAVIWEPGSQTLRLVNDRLGLYPIYYASQNGTFLFGSGVRALLAHPHLPRSVDRLAIAQFLTFDHILHDRTLLSAARLMPQGSFLTIHNGDVRIRVYSSLRYPETYPLRQEDDYMEELVALLCRAVERQAADDLPKGVMLSGGLDSRVLLACLNRIPAAWPLHTFTWGIPGCDDARYAGEVAALTRAQHHFFELKPDYLLHCAENAVRITDGMGNVVNLHAIANLDEEVPFARVIYKGFMGDAMFGFAVVPPFWADYDPETAVRVHFGVHQSQGVITFTPEEQKKLFTADFLAQIGDGVMQSYRAGMEAAQARQLASQRLYFDLTQRVPRMTLNGVEVVRSQAVVRLPFCDNDLLDFAIHTPPGLLQERRLIQRAFVHAFPEMAKIPLSWTGLPMIENFRSLSMRGRRLLQWHLYHRGLSKTPEGIWKPYKDYRSWFRTVLKGWVESILLSERFMGRGYYQPDYVRQLVAAHMAGEDHTVRLGAMISIELWHRQFIDE